MRRILKQCLPFVLLMHAAATMAVEVHVDIDTHALPATGFVVAFDLVDGGLPANTVALSHLRTDGSFAAATFTGDAMASAGAMTLGDSQFFNEILLPLSSATAMSFDVDMTLAAPAPGSLPDAFSLFLLDGSTLLPLFSTTDPTGAQSLFTIQSGDSPLGPLTTFTDSGSGPATAWSVTAIAAVPEPASVALMLAGLTWLLVRRGVHRRLARSVGLAVLVLPGLVQAAIHVMPGGGANSPHDGAKWESAYSATELQTAINMNAGAEFWLSKGAYGQLQNVSDGTRLYGGFVGGLFGEMTRDERDPVANYTAFDGIVIVPYDDGSGSGRLIIQGPATTIDGFHVLGFGFILEKASPTLANNVIAAAPVGIDLRMGAAPTINDSQIVGTDYGIFVSGPAQFIGVGPNRIEARPTINRSTISGQSRGGVFSDIGIGLGENSSGTLPTLVVNASTFSGSTSQAMELYGDAQFSDSIVEKNGTHGLPAIQVGAGDPGRIITFDRCKIRDNQGTGLLASPSTDTTVSIRRSEVTGNNSSQPPGGGPEGVPHAGGVQVNSDGVQIVETKIVGNRTTSVGGGVYFAPFIKDVSRNVIVNSLIAGNSAAVHGGGIASAPASFSVLNSTIVGNSAPIGGGVWLDPYILPSFKPTVSIVNTAIVGNSAPLGSAIALETFTASPTSIFRNDVTLAADTYASSYTIVARPSPLDAGSFTVSDPVFIAAASGDYGLGSGSPLIDRGDSAPISAYIAAGGTPTDLAGKPRIAGAAVDVGAYEAAAAGVSDITSQISLRLGGLVFDRATRRYAQVATLINSSGGSLSGPISLVFDGLPAGVTVSGMTNVTLNQLPAGSPYIDVLAADFAPGALLTLNLRFDDPFNAAIRYVPRVLGGSGTR